MKLYLVQHGEALSKEEDPDRPLSNKGRQDVERMASFLARSTRVDRVIHSGKPRARQTALLLAAVIGPGNLVEEAAFGLAPNNSTDALATAVEQWATDDECPDIMLVGHLPFMERIVSRLCACGDSTAVAAFRPGAVACLTPIAPGDWALNWLVRPELLGS